MDENAIIRQLTEIDSRSKSNTHRLDRLEKLADSVNNLAQSVALMAATQKSMSEKLDETCEDVKAIKDAPADSWRELKKGILVALAGVLVGFLSAKLGI